MLRRTYFKVSLVSDCPRKSIQPRPIPAAITPPATLFVEGPRLTYSSSTVYQSISFVFRFVNSFFEISQKIFNYRCRIAIERGRMLARAPGRVLHTECLFSGNNIRIERLTAVYERDLADLIAGSGGDLFDHLLGSLLFYSLAVIHGHEVARVDLRDKLGHGD